MDTILACIFAAFVIGWLMGITTYDGIMKLAIYLVRTHQGEIGKKE
jgi:hypothetical protein